MFIYPPPPQLIKPYPYLCFDYHNTSKVLCNPLPPPLTSAGLDFNHVSVLATTHGRATTPPPPGSTIPPVPSSLVQKIEAGALIEFGDLVPSNLGFEETAGSKSKQHPVTSIAEWLQAFAVYVSIITRKQPQHVPDLMGYQILMLEASNGYKSSSWLAYNRRFRQQAAAQPNCQWSKIDSTIWNLTFTGQAKASCCRHCFSLFHLSKDCTFASSTTSSQADQPLPMPYRRRYICQQWNEQPGHGCSYPNCRYNTSAIIVLITLQLLMSIIRLYITQAILASNLPLANVLHRYSHDHDLLHIGGHS